MVRLTLSSTNGTGARYFPHAGYLALTPLKVEGVVRTRLEGDRKPLLASDIVIAVRCYEARIGRTGITHSNLLVDYHTPLWSKPSHEAWGEVGDGDWPFRLVLSPKLAGHSTANFQEYRVFWRVEAVLNHVPMMGVGHRKVKTYDLPLMRYDLGEALPASPSVWAHAAPSGPSRPPALRYLINTPPFPLGPLDVVPVSLKLHPSDPAASVHAVTLAVERRLEFKDTQLGARALGDDTSLSSTTNLVGHGEPFVPAKGFAKVNTFLVTSTEATDVPRDENGVYAKTLTLQVPMQKSTSHWAVGETMHTALIALRFFLRVKVTLSTPHGTLETLDLAERELCLISTNESQRRLAMSKYTEAMEQARVRDANRVRSSSPSPTEGMAGMSGSSLHGKASGKGKGTRRPHTSAGPRDSVREVARGASRRESQGFRDIRVRSRAKHGHPSSSERVSEEGGSAAEPVRGWDDELERVETRSHGRSVVQSPMGMLSPRSAPALMIRSFFTSPPSPLPPPLPLGSTTESEESGLSAAADSVQAWEEELERIAVQSRRRSVEMLGFNPERRTRPRIDGY